jgi:methanogenic corrinoid protein MtbC1
MSKRVKSQSVDQRLERLKVMITELQEEASLEQLRRLLTDGVDAELLLECCMEGMHRVGARFESGFYFIAALIMAGEIMRSATDLLSPYLVVQQAESGGGRVMLGTIQGDIHDLGKDLFGLLCKCHGIEVIDLGVDVSAQQFLEQADKHKPDLIGISCVLTASVENLKETIELFGQYAAGVTPPVVIGGTYIDEQMAAYIGAHYWANNANTGLRICKQLLLERGNSKRWQSHTL